MGRKVIDKLRSRNLIPGTPKSRPLHAYAVAECIHGRSHDVLQLDEGAFYPALHHLELRGLLFEERGASENNRRAKLYQVTVAGGKHLQTQRERSTHLAAAVGFVLAGT